LAPRETQVERVRKLLLVDLLAERHATGEQLPNEYVLADRFDVSRATVREAVRGLMDAGYLNREHGRGTFVTALPRRQHSLDATVSYTDMIKASGMTPAVRVLAIEVRAAHPDESEKLGVVADTNLICIERVRTADGQPAIYSHDRIPSDLLPASVRQGLYGSLYGLLRSVGFQVDHAVAALRPVLTDSRLAGILEVAVGSPLQYIVQVDYTAADQPVMLSEEWHVPDLFELKVNRRQLVADLPR
jgi:GntR family transcriptional regulator